MKISIVPKFRSTTFTAQQFELGDDEELINYELPKELIDAIRKPPKAIVKGEENTVPDWVNTYNVYLIIKKEV